MDVVGRYADLLNYYREHYGELLADDVYECNQHYSKEKYTRTTYIKAEKKDGTEIDVEHTKSKEWTNEGEWISVWVNRELKEKTEVKNFFGCPEVTTEEELKKLLNIK